MGTNYYTKENECKHCGRHEEIHLGKSSFGWQFSFQYNSGKYYKNVKEMKKWLKSKVIKDEYGATVSYEYFWKMVKAKQTKENQNHVEYMMKENPNYEREYIIDGYSFSDCEFS